MYIPDGMVRLRDSSITSKPKRRIPVSITLFFFLLAFLFGVNFGVTKVIDKKLNGIAKIISSITSIFIIFILHAPLTFVNEDYVWYLSSFVQYILYFLVIRLSKYNVWDLLVDLHNTDGMTGIKRKRIGIIIWMYAFVIYSTKWVIMYICCEILFPELCVIDYIPYYLYCVPSLGIDFVSIVLFLVYYYICWCVRDLNRLLRKTGDIRKLKERYVAIADYVENIRPLYEKLIIVELLFEVPKMMSLMYNMCSYYFQKADLLTSFAEYVYASHIIAHIVSSGAMVQMVRSQMDYLTVYLHNILLDEQDPKKVEEINRLLVYMGARRLWRPVQGVVPVDMQLPVSALSVCVTYLIVLVQFSHLV